MYRDVVHVAVGQLIREHSLASADSRWHDVAFQMNDGKMAPLVRDVKKRDFLAVFSWASSTPDAQAQTQANGTCCCEW